MSIPRHISVQTIAGLRDNVHNYESHKRTISAVNQIIDNLAPGDSVKPQNFSLGAGLGTGATLNSLSGTFKRGSFLLTLGAGGFSPNPTITINFPNGVFTTPFAIVVRNGGNGTLGFAYSQSGQSLVITLSGTGTSGATYGFQFDVRE